MTEEIEYLDIPDYTTIDNWEITLEKPICKFCGRALIKWRENKFSDWTSRKYHRTCWKKKMSL